MKLVIGTRGSALATAQTGHMAGRLQDLGHEVVIELIETRGDRETDKIVPELGGKGLFTAELERAILDGRVQAAVHSLKDLPTEETPALCVAAVPARVEPRDALVAAGGGALAGLPRGARVGTASLRRKALLLHARPDLEIVPLRGNVDTRLGKVRSGELDAVVVAAAGLQRLGRAAEISELLDFLPAPAQGALAIQAHAERADVLAALAPLHDAPTAHTVHAERALLHALEGGCSVPIGALAELKNGELHLRACVASVDGRTLLEVEATGVDAEAVGLEAARLLREKGAEEILRAGA